ncbi:MAG: gamma-glutamyl-gamma-aminobutyrate hydrolase family protein [Planctomycetaceae bacterium]|nr:gamma-glutamyl-gamma-aminobutyrate hydrolase family protein [Planctomycetaceae bacterium]
MATKPLIGFNGDYRAARKDTIALSWFNTGYYDTISAAKIKTGPKETDVTNGIPVPIVPLADDAELKQLLGMLDGLVLAGCTQDLDPIRMGMEKHPATRSMPLRREDFDRRLCRMAVEMRMPILAIGGGMQLLNVICGGTLYQHIAEDCPRALHHCDPVESTLRHVIEIVPGTRVDTIYGPGEIRINSQHHQSVNTVAKGFRVSARAPDGVIEAFESEDPDWFCLGVQWHPENESSSALDMQVFEQFLTAIVDQKQPVILPMRKAG